MKQLAQYQDGRLELQEAPNPVAPPGGILVRTTHSVSSAGTERMKVEQARMNLVHKTHARPHHVRKVMDTARTLGWRSALEKVRNRLETPTPLGYSAAGVVVQVDQANTRFRVGERVACGGAECAFHAEYIGVPAMLAVAVPDGVENWEAAYTTLCAIAMQAVRQGAAHIGERAVVIGQGLVGLLVTGILNSAGVRVMAVDVMESRRSCAEAMGAERVVIAGQQKLSDEARAWTDGLGVDVAFVCTAGRSNTPVEQAAEVLRDRGRLVIVGIVNVELPQKVFYEKELEVRYSRSYGPGRYDAAYEWGGVDYPAGYVRWTEQRNFEACLDLMARRRINLQAITTRRVPFSDALSVYQELSSGRSEDIGVVLEYGEASPVAEPTRAIQTVSRPFEPDASVRISAPVGRVDVIGGGNFARTMLLPHLQGKIELGTVVNQTALSAAHVKVKFGFKTAATDVAAVLGKNDGAVLIATRHHLHAPLTLKALELGRHVFVEKPLCLTHGELEEIDVAVAKSQRTVMVGFNRRFAPATIELKRFLGSLPGPKSVTYRVMAGPLDPKHWYANREESGGRVLGEACHFLDYFCHLFESRPVRVTAQPISPPSKEASDSVAAQVEFADGSCGQLVYSAEGDAAYPKETLTVFGSGLSAELINFQKLILYRDRKRQSFSYSSKGHAEEMSAWLAFLRGEAPHPLPYAQGRQSMLVTFAVLQSIQESRSIQL